MWVVVVWEDGKIKSKGGERVSRREDFCGTQRRAPGDLVLPLTSSES